MKDKCKKLVFGKAIVVVLSGLQLLYIFFSLDSVDLEEAKFDFTTVSFQQQHSSLTILMDWRNCQAACMFVHPILPRWVQFQYRNLNMSEITNSSLHGSSHYMVIMRGNISSLAAWSQKHRVKFGVSIGLWLMADELDNFNYHYNFASFDYVIRHYYFQTKLDLFFLRALGNHTCGESPVLPTLRRGEPRWGVHWGFLAPHKPHSLLSRPPATTVLASRRERNCGFLGRFTRQREFMKQEIERLYPKMECLIQFSEGFTLGSDKFKYLAEDLQNIKIGLNPPGNNMECHRLSELLVLGTVPAMIDEKYLHAPFRPVPGIIGKDWGDLGNKMLSVLSVNKSKELDAMSKDAAFFYEEILSCMRSDMDYILNGAFNDARLGYHSRQFRLVKSKING